jgi:DNA-binding NarL/FixJ family response regulator
MIYILIVDDSFEVRRSLRDLLEQQPGWRCGEAENGLEGIARAKQSRPDLIVMDLSMPVMNGLDAAKELKRLMPAVPIVMFTTFASAHIATAALAAGADAFQTKSETGALVDSIQGLLSGEYGAHPA